MCDGEIFQGICRFEDHMSRCLMADPSEAVGEQMKLVSEAMWLRNKPMSLNAIEMFSSECSPFMWVPPFSHMKLCILVRGVFPANKLLQFISSVSRYSGFEVFEMRTLK